MKAYVYTDKGLERYAGQFVWLSIDTENPANAPFLKKYPIEGVPTLFIFDPRKERVALRWLGSATTAQLTKLFEDGKRAVAPAGDTLTEALAKADRLYGEGKNAEAAKAFEQVLRQAPKGWSRRGRVTESLLFALYSSDQHEHCARTAQRAWPLHKDTASAMNIAAVGLDCALHLPKELEGRPELISILQENALTTMANPKVEVAADDRSGLYMVLISAREDASDAPGTKEVTAEWAAFLEREAARAETPDARAVFDSHRLSAYLALEQPERAIPMLEASERDLPDDYNPPARLAVAYRAAKRYPEALAAADRALAKVYGPRKVRVLMSRADILADMGDKAAAKQVLDEALALAESAPPGQRSEGMISSLKKKIAELS